MMRGRYSWHNVEGEKRPLGQKVILDDLLFEDEDEICDEGADLIGWMLEKVPEERIPILDIPTHPFLSDM